MQENNYWQNNWKAIVGFSALLLAVLGTAFYMKKQNVKQVTHKVEVTEKTIDNNNEVKLG